VTRVNAPATTAPSPARRAQLNRRSLRLAYPTAGRNAGEGVVAVAAGAAARPGFGRVSYVEVSSAWSADPVAARVDAAA
jgi:hypothetical protein